MISSMICWVVAGRQRPSTNSLRASLISKAILLRDNSVILVENSSFQRRADVVGIDIVHKFDAAHTAGQDKTEFAVPDFFVVHHRL
jgi:hypothetical protein